MASKTRFKIACACDLDIITQSRFSAVISEYQRRYNKKDSEMYLAQFVTRKLAPDAKVEVIEGYTNLSSGAFTTEIVSSSANDHIGHGTTCEEVIVYYIDANGAPAHEHVAMHATNGTTHVHWTTAHKRVIGMEASVGTPAGNITMNKVGDVGTCYCTIVAGDIYSITATMWCGLGWNMAIVSLISSIVFSPSATPPAYGDFANVYVDANATVTDAVIVTHDNCGKNIIDPAPLLPVAGVAAGSYISIQHESTHTDVNVEVTENVTYLLWK